METPPEQAEDLATLIQWIKDETGDNESDIARKISAAPATVNAWVLKKRGTKRGPNREKLRALAGAYGLSEERVFAAAQRPAPGPLDDDAKDRILRLYEELTVEQQQLHELHLRATVEHNRSGS